MTRAAVALAALALVVACHPRPAPPPVIGNRPGDHDEVAPAHGDITTAGLEALFARRFPSQLADGTLTREWNGTEADVLAELAAMGWHDLAQVEAAIPRDFARKAGVQFTHDDPANMPGTLRDIMILHDARRYFERAWQNHWGSLAPGDIDVYRAYGIDLAPLRAAGVIDDESGP